MNSKNGWTIKLNLEHQHAGLTPAVLGELELLICMISVTFTKLDITFAAVVDNHH